MVERKLNVNFFCQRCLQPLKLDDSFGVIGEHTLAELTLPVHTTPEVDIEAASIDHLIPAFHLDDSGNGTNGFTLLGPQGESGEFYQLYVTARLFDIVSANSEIDHPLCEECADVLIDLMDQQLKLTGEESEDYSQFLRKLKNESIVESLDVLEKELEQLTKEEERLNRDLDIMQEEEKDIQEECNGQENVKESFERDEERYWKEYSKYRNEFILIEDERRSLECQLSYAQNQLDKLKRTNVFNATFHIWHSGHFGTINNFKLGRLPSAPVDWSEINAAWGQTALLLTALAHKMNFSFSKFRLVPYGNHSYIEVVSEQRILPLYGSGGFRFLWDTKFDAAMVAFLECLQQFKEEVEKGDSGFCLPYRIDKGKLEDSATGHSFSIKIQFNSEEQWTKALKFLLTNLKWGLAWVSSQFAKEQNELIS
uniref:Beclin-1-like protein n=2 Tax=Lygus hesperus TaxID=30085 RepID=A0A0A9YDV6_LYGHE